MTEPVSSLEQVSVTYPTDLGPVEALSEVTLSFDAASSTSIIGRSGSGKSTLISVLALMRSPSSGEVLFEGNLVSTLSTGDLASLRARRIGIVFQSFHLEASLTAVDNLLLSWVFDAHRGSRKQAERRAIDVLEGLGIGELARRRPGEMSGGQRQRVAIGRALFPSPALFVADEPTGNLDEDTANAVSETIFSLPALFGTAVVVVTHDATVAAMADRQVSLVRGRLERAGATS